MLSSRSGLARFGAGRRDTARFKVKAYTGPLPSGERGVEFDTDVAPDKWTPPGKPLWTGPRSGVRVEHGIAKLQVRWIRNFQK
jgi:hypothetical protein